MTIPCVCNAQLQPHDWMQNVCPEPPREVHDREMDQVRDFEFVATVSGGLVDGDSLTVREYLDMGGQLPLGLELDDEVQLFYDAGSNGTARFV